MYISKRLDAQLACQTAMKNDEFLCFQIAQLQRLFVGELLAIKNIKLEYIAFSESYAVEFDLDGCHLGTQGGEGIDDITQNMILAQEQQVIYECGCQDSSYFYKKNNSLKVCGVRKRQLVNPATGDAVGLVIVASKFDPGFVRKIFIRKLFPQVVKFKSNFNANLTDYQQQVAFCLLVGFHSRREIAQILHGSVNSEVNENKIKNSLQMLYHKFDCNSTSQLLSLIANNIINVSLPINLLPNGTSFPIE